jgi:hypothetical protein
MTLEAAAEGAMDLSIDTQTLMRLSVSRRIEMALGVAHLHQDPTKHPKEDFMSPKTLSIIEDAAKMRELGRWKHAKLSLVIVPLFFRTASASPQEADGDSPPHIADRDVLRNAPAKAAIRLLLGTRARRMPTLTPTNKSGHGPRMGLGYTFDSTLGYPGEGPSPSPHYRRGTLRIWSTKRLHTTLVDPVPIPSNLHGDRAPLKTTHGNSDTSLGRWLHTVRAQRY